MASHQFLMIARSDPARASLAVDFNETTRGEVRDGERASIFENALQVSFAWN